MKRRLFSLCVALCLLFPALAPQDASAHPHAWIDIKTGLVIDGSRNLVAMRQTWIFDEIYTAFSIEGAAAFDKTNEEQVAKLTEFGAQVIQRLEGFNYFTTIQSKGEALGFQQGTFIHADITANRLVIEFELPLTAPISLIEDAVQYAVYDPTYYVEILHQEGAGPVSFVNDAGIGAACGSDILPPNPDAETVSFAYSLGPDESGGGGLGIHFAEWVTLSCE